MTQLNPAATTAGDLCRAALKEAGAVGTGQSASNEDLLDAQARLQWMLQEWERKSQLVYHLADLSVVSTGAQVYSIGPGGMIDTNQLYNPFPGTFTEQFAGPLPVSARPMKIESAFFRQLIPSQPNQIDFPLRIIHSRDDYNRIALKQLQTFPGWLFYDASWPLGGLYPWPVPQANIYELHVTVVDQLPPMFATQATVVNLPFEYFSAIVLNLGLRLRPKYGIATYPGDMLPGLAKGALATLRKANLRTATLTMPGDLIGQGRYNIFSDQNH